MEFQYDDGGRKAAGYKGNAGDCAVRAIAIACEMPYQDAYDLVNRFGKMEKKGKRRRGKSSARTGVYGPTMRKIMDHLGWQWIPTMHIGSGCKVHLVADELPAGRIICNLSKHFTAVIDGVIHDTYNPAREAHHSEAYDGRPLKPGEWITQGNWNGGDAVHRIIRRCVYGYWIKEE